MEALQEPLPSNWVIERSSRRQKETKVIEISDNEGSKVGVEVGLEYLPREELIT